MYIYTSIVKSIIITHIYATAALELFLQNVYIDTYIHTLYGFIDRGRRLYTGAYPAHVLCAIHCVYVLWDSLGDALGGEGIFWLGERAFLGWFFFLAETRAVSVLFAGM